ncbi:MAG: hypothetical protein GX638_01800 [Crenarchaeota archaeon]|nr:hypothetical protein [Thermoproteota archaeon]
MYIPLLNVALKGLPDWSLNERDVDVLDFLAEEQFRCFTFEGLKRRLGLHPEILSRVLNHLETEGIIKKSSEGYTLIKDLSGHISQNKLANVLLQVNLLQTYLPSDVAVEQLISDLRGRWFGLLRWLGFSETIEDVTLKWITEDGAIQIEARIYHNTLNIDAKFLKTYNTDLALKAAYQIVTYIGKLCSHSKVPSTTHVDYAKMFYVPSQKI